MQNHPRWDPDIQLEQVADGPIGLGTKIRPTNTRWGEPVEGEMEVVEWEPERAAGFAIRDANMEMQGGATFEAIEPDRTRLTVSADVPGLDDEEQGSHMSTMMKRSSDNMKQLCEADIRA